MINMAKKQQIIIGYHEGKSQQAIAQSLGISRTTVFNYLQAYRAQNAEVAKGLASQGVVDAPRYKTTNRPRRKLTDTICALIDEYLAKNAEKRRLGQRKQQVKNIDIHEALLRQGHDIGYSSVNTYIRTHHQKVREAYIRQHPIAGESVEFDWGEVKIKINGQLRTFQLAVFTCTYSNHRWAQLFDRQDMCSFLQAHVLYFSLVRKVYHEIVYDNMRTAVAKFAVKNKDKQATEGLLKLSVYYCFSIRFCNAYRGNEKGHVERSVEYVRRKAFGLTDSFNSRDQANQHLLEILQSLNLRPAAGQTQRIDQRHQQALEQMRPLPVSPYDVGQLNRAKVDKYSCIKVDTNYYSVPDNLVGKRLDIKIYPHQIIVYSADNQMIAKHERHRTRFQYYLQIDHYLITLSRKPGALKGSLTLLQADATLRAIFKQYFKEQPKVFIEILLFLKEKKLSLTNFKKATQQCVRICPHQSPCVDKIKFFLTTKNANPVASTPKHGVAKNIQQHAQEQLAAIQALVFSN
jgi:transposase